MNEPNTRHGHFFWNELMSADIPESKAFYETVLGWTYSETPMPEGGTYTVVMDGDTPVAGLFHMPDAPPSWVAYVAVDDVDAAAARVVAAGGTVLQPCFDVEGVGRFAMIADPSGAALGLCTPS
jgi:predicted enzyme related to lactoylglutathione lyase